MARRAPSVLAIGGSASVGKTAAALSVAAGRGVAVVHVDDLRHEMVGPGFAATMPDVWRRPGAELVDILRDETARLVPPITAAVAGLLASATGGVIEGEGIEPALTARWSPDDVHAVFVVEDDADRLRAVFAARSSRDRFLALDASEQRAVVDMNLRYGEWLRAEAAQHGARWLPSHPRSTLADRIGDGVPT